MKNIDYCTFKAPSQQNKNLVWYANLKKKQVKTRQKVEQTELKHKKMHIVGVGCVFTGYTLNFLNARIEPYEENIYFSVSLPIGIFTFHESTNFHHKNCRRFTQSSVFFLL